MYRYVFPISSSTIFNHLCCGEFWDITKTSRMEQVKVGSAASLLWATGDRHLHVMKSNFAGVVNKLVQLGMIRCVRVKLGYQWTQKIEPV